MGILLCRSWGTGVLALVFLVTSPILQLLQICQSRKILLKLPEQVPTSSWAGEMEAAEKQEEHGLFQSPAWTLGAPCTRQKGLYFNKDSRFYELPSQKLN